MQPSLPAEMKGLHPPSGGGVELEVAKAGTAGWECLLLGLAEI